MGHLRGEGGSRLKSPSPLAVRDSEPGPRIESVLDLSLQLGDLRILSLRQLQQGSMTRNVILGVLKTLNRRPQLGDLRVEVQSVV